jgi:predicted dienelactone hydrolase
MMNVSNFLSRLASRLPRHRRTPPDFDEMLADAGFVVAAINHPGFDRAAFHQQFDKDVLAFSKAHLDDGLR